MRTKTKKSWLYILLFSLLLSFCGECGDPIESHTDFTASHTHVLESGDDGSILCDSCHNCHVKIVLDDLDLKIPHIYITKPQFQQYDYLAILNSSQLLKPPIS